MSPRVHSESKGLHQTITLPPRQLWVLSPCGAGDRASMLSRECAGLGSSIQVSQPCIHGEPTNLSLQVWFHPMSRLPHEAQNPAKHVSRVPCPACNRAHSLPGGTCLDRACSCHQPYFQKDKVGMMLCQGRHPSECTVLMPGPGPAFDLGVHLGPQTSLRSPSRTS